MKDRILVQLSGIRKSFGDNLVLGGIELSVAAGEVIVIAGPSGSGKSTMLRCVNGLETVDAGEVRFDGQLVTPGKELSALRAQIGFVFQQFHLFPHMSVLDNITLAPVKVKGIAAAQARQSAHELLERVGIAEKADQYPADLSGGQQQRVAIARALAMDPAVLLCDEITSALDPELVGEVLRVVESLAQEGMTLLMVTHEMSFARRVSDRLVFMHAGRIHEVGPPEQVFGAPQTPELKQFLSALDG